VVDFGLPDERPEMPLYSDYAGPDKKSGEDLGQDKMRSLPEGTNANEFSKMLVEKICPMPCVHERAIGRNPPHDVRVKVGVMFLAAGYSVNDTLEVIRGLNWIDFDKETTRANLETIAKNGKGDYSCRTMQSKGLCVRADNKPECEAYGYRGGNEPER
jgi:hypothetical protein